MAILQSDSLHVQQSFAQSSPDYRADGLVIENGGNPRFQAGLSILSHEQSSGNVFFGDRTNPKAGQIKYNHYTDNMYFYTRGRQQLQITTAGISVDGYVSCKNLFVQENTTFSLGATFYAKTKVDSLSTTEENLNLDVPSGNVTKNVLTVSQNETYQGGLHFTYGDYGASGVISLLNERFGLKLRSPSANQHAIEPCTPTGLDKDNAVDLGRSSNRFDDIYATNGSIQTSDRNEKQNIQELSEAEQRVAVVAKGLLRKFKWKEAVNIKGDSARVHFGIIAQDLQEAFEAEGLDASEYGMFTKNTWWTSNGNTYEVEDNAPEGATEHTRLGVRYSELLAFIIAGL